MMITKDQQKWLDHLSDTDKIVIKPYDPKSCQIFESVKKEIVGVLGKVRVLERGASYLKISGQDEIDIYVPVSPKYFDKYVKKMAELFSAPGSFYTSVRARFSIFRYGKKVDIFIINREDKGWTGSELFTKYLIKYPRVLDKYEKMKENGNGKNTREYYSEKIKFTNRIIKMAEEKMAEIK